MLKGFHLLEEGSVPYCLYDDQMRNAHYELFLLETNPKVG
jgi:hypothetical protein